MTRDGEQRSIGDLHISAALDTLRVELERAHRPPIVLMVVDTVRASLSGSEDSSEHVSAYLRVIRRLMAALPGAACILAHHAGWQDGKDPRKRERGSSAWRGNCDATLYLDAGEYDAEHHTAPLTIRALKVRDAERPAALHLIRRRVELAESNGHLEPVTSCVIDRDPRSREDIEAQTRAAEEEEHREFDLRVLRALIDQAKDGQPVTSQTQLQTLLNVRQKAISSSVARLIQKRWIRLPGQRKPYLVTDAGGREVLLGRSE
jgi:hypothetical protein